MLSFSLAAPQSLGGKQRQKLVRAALAARVAQLLLQLVLVAQTVAAEHLKRSVRDLEGGQRGSDLRGDRAVKPPESGRLGGEAL